MRLNCLRNCEEKERKVAAQKRVAQRRAVLRVKKDMWLRMGTWWLWKAELAHELARSLRTILPLVCQNHLLSGFWHLPSWTIKTLREPCANLALPCSTTAFSWGPATKRKCKTCQRHSNVTLILFCLLYLFGKGPCTTWAFYKPQTNTTEIPQFTYPPFVSHCWCCCRQRDQALVGDRSGSNGCFPVEKRSMARHPHGSREDQSIGA